MVEETIVFFCLEFSKESIFQKEAGYTTSEIYDNGPYALLYDVF